MSADAPPLLVCSARGCRAAPAWALLWRNPRLHDESRRKTWLACPEHREHLEAFLAARGFPLEVRSAPSGSAPPG